MWSLILRNVLWWLFIAAAAVYIILGLPGSASARWVGGVLVAAAGLAVGLAATWRSAFGLGLIRGFRTIRYGEIELRCPADLADGEEPQWVASWLDELVHLARRQLALPTLQAPRVWLVPAKALGTARGAAPRDATLVGLHADGAMPDLHTLSSLVAGLHEVLRIGLADLGPASPPVKGAGLTLYVAHALPEARGRPFGYPLHRVAANLLALGVLPSVHDLADIQAGVKGGLIRGVAASFTAALVQEVGWDTYWRLYRGGTGEWPVRAPDGTEVDPAQLERRWHEVIREAFPPNDGFLSTVRALYRALGEVLGARPARALALLEGVQAEGESWSIARQRLLLRMEVGDTNVEADAALVEQAAPERPLLHAERLALRARVWAALHRGDHASAASLLEDAVGRWGPSAQLFGVTAVGQAVERLRRGELQAADVAPMPAANRMSIAGDPLCLAAILAARSGSTFGDPKEAP